MEINLDWGVLGTSPHGGPQHRPRNCSSLDWPELGLMCGR